WQISTDGGTEAVWNRNGRELFYRQGNQMMAVTVRTETDFSAENPRVLFEGAYRSNFFYTADYDVTPDGQRFVMIHLLNNRKVDLLKSTSSSTGLKNSSAWCQRGSDRKVRLHMVARTAPFHLKYQYGVWLIVGCRRKGALSIRECAPFLPFKSQWGYIVIASTG
ncbi:MAG: hypothetical protein O7G29_13975, partial [Acidobacteria bacterium]|nr:hypothetical protein [Acidobacteriota bacterium]